MAADIRIGSRVTRTGQAKQRTQMGRTLKVGIVERLETKNGKPRAHVKWLNGTLRYNGNSVTRSSVKVSDLTQIAPFKSIAVVDGPACLGDVERA